MYTKNYTCLLLYYRESTTRVYYFNLEREVYVLILLLYRKNYTCLLLFYRENYTNLLLNFRENYTCLFLYFRGNCAYLSLYSTEHYSCLLLNFLCILKSGKQTKMMVNLSYSRSYLQQTPKK